jgi:hypothetical protein
MVLNQGNVVVSRSTVYNQSIWQADFILCLRVAFEVGWLAKTNKPLVSPL